MFGHDSFRLARKEHFGEFNSHGGLVKGESRRRGGRKSRREVQSFGLTGRGPCEMHIDPKDNLASFRLGTKHGAYLYQILNDFVAKGDGMRITPGVVTVDVAKPSIYMFVGAHPFHESLWSWHSFTSRFLGHRSCLVGTGAALV